MNTTPPDPGAQPDERIAALIGEYFDRKQSGEQISPESFAAEHPDDAEELRPFLEALSILGTMQSTGGGPARAPARGTADPNLPMIAGYEIQAELGRGGMGVVYKALQISTKRIVAVKVILAGSFASSSVRRRFEREVELAVRLQHSGIVRVLESGYIEQQQYYAMDFVAGRSLDEYLATAKPKRDSILRLFIQICEAVAYAHDLGVMHRDLKPSNVIVDEKAAPHILDFGLAKAIDEAEADESRISGGSVPGQVMGTLPYLSPEQAGGLPGDIDARTDVYALGVMLYEALTGKLPYDTTGRPSEVIRRIVEDAPTPPSSLPEWTDGELNTIILKALEKEKERRYPSVAALGEDLRRYLDGEPILARRPSSFYVLRKKIRKHRVGVIVSVIAAVAVCVLIIALIFDAARRHEEFIQARWSALTVQRILELGGEEDAVARARAIVAKQPGLIEGQLVCAHAMFLANRQDEAIVQLERSIRSDPSQWSWVALLAEIYRTMGDVERADELVAQVERDAPDTAEAWYLRSFATLELSRALECAQESVSRRSDDPLTWNRLTHLRLDAGDVAGAMDGAERLIELGEDRVQWTVFKGDLLARQGLFDAAIEQYTEAERLAPNAANVLRSRALAYRRTGRYEQAVADYTTVIQSVPEPASVAWEHYQRATPLWILGRTDESLDDYRQFRVYLGRPFFSDVRQYVILHEAGREMEAETLLASALRDVKNHWLRQIFRCLDGSITPEELVNSTEAQSSLEKLCEAYYYAGEAALLADERADAQRFFEMCVRTGLDFDPNTMNLTPMNEFELAQWRLRTQFEPAGQ